MSRVVNEAWNRHYEWASRTRLVDPLEVYRQREERRDRRCLVGCWMALSAVVSVFYFVLIR